MLNKAFLTCVVCVFAGFLPVQAADFGIRAGINYSSVPSSDQFPFFSSGLLDHRLEVSRSSHSGFHFGVFAGFSFANVFIQPELIFEETKQELQLVREDQTIDHRDINRFKPRFSNLKIPVTAGIQLGILRVGAGPYYAYLLDNPRSFVSFFDTDDTLVFHYNESRMGYQVMAGIKIGNISLDYRFEGSISRLGDCFDVNGSPYDFSIRQNQHVISLGIVVF